MQNNTESDFIKLRGNNKLPSGMSYGPNCIERSIILKIKGIFCSQLLYSIVKKIHDYSESIILHKESKRKFEETLSNLNVKEEIYDESSVFGYTGDTEYHDFVVLKNYRDQIKGGFSYPSESKILYEHVCEFGDFIIKQTDSDIWFNLGICYAYCESILAGKNPNTQFLGIERTMLPKLLNEYYLPNCKNLNVLYGDVFEHFKKNKYPNGILHHARTMVLMPPSFIVKFYNAAKEAGFKYIFGVEQYGFSRQIQDHFEFSYEEKDSVGFRGSMYIHNYPALLKECGFEIVKIDSIKTDHPHDDYRLLSFFAKAI